MKNIPDALYSQIVGVMPLLCVDLVVVHELTQQLDPYPYPLFVNQNNNFTGRVIGC